ncbi:MAG: Crp/Fnr family transcriptional regulator [Bacteroidetes bacterium]|nr:Crp/Fnr family transcriptional regulator [Bacteroidota bacterium]
MSKIEHQAYYLLSGIVKISIYNEEGTERVLEFFFPNSFFAAYTSFLTQQASDVEIEALTDCEVEIIKHYDIHKAYETSLLANRLGRAVAEQYYIRKTNREKDFLTTSAVERYKNLLDNRPELVQQIPVQLIAKYLGIEPESLSRIRKSIS